MATSDPTFGATNAPDEPAEQKLYPESCTAIHARCIRSLPVIAQRAGLTRFSDSSAAAADSISMVFWFDCVNALPTVANLDPRLAPTGLQGGSESLRSSFEILPRSEPCRIKHVLAEHGTTIVLLDDV